MPFNITSVDQRQSRAGSHMEHRCVQLPTGISALRYKQHMASEIECIIHPAFSRSYAAVPSSADGAAGDQLGCLHPGDRFQCSPSQMRSTRSGGIICDIMTTRDSLRRQMHGAFPFNQLLERSESSIRRTTLSMVKLVSGKQFMANPSPPLSVNLWAKALAPNQ
ncbi:hypothetical protein M513_05283 [Trichuris suis]|uniref:Uncharacterized protein n=1 Tax=Trichuris suis TaxID=68888 RepID=A0A085M981_9BILA|nr:hypothetical protein M513_05283 [Trichuris suis]